MNASELLFMSNHNNFVIKLYANITLIVETNMFEYERKRERKCDTGQVGIFTAIKISSSYKHDNRISQNNFFFVLKIKKKRQV